MKKILLLTALLGIMFGATAQNTQKRYDKVAHIDFKESSGSASTSLTITLHPIQAISINTSDIQLSYGTVSDYTNGVGTGWIPNHLKVFSTGSYVVKVNYLSTAANPVENHNEIFKQVKVSVYGGASINLEPTAAELISSDNGDFNKFYGVNYTAGKNYTNHSHGTNPREYRTVVVYTIKPK